jgi:hypothetical protein
LRPGRKDPSRLLNNEEGDTNDMIDERENKLREFVHWTGKHITGDETLTSYFDLE